MSVEPRGLEPRPSAQLKIQSGALPVLLAS